jgi:hypothetical protein
MDIDSNFGTTKFGTQIITPTTLEVVHVPNKARVSRLVYPNDGQS